MPHAGSADPNILRQNKPLRHPRDESMGLSDVSDAMLFHVKQPVAECLRAREWRGTRPPSHPELTHRHNERNTERAEQQGQFLTRGRRLGAGYFDTGEPKVG